MNNKTILNNNREKELREEFENIKQTEKKRRVRLIITFLLIFVFSLGDNDIIAVIIAVIGLGPLVLSIPDSINAPRKFRERLSTDLMPGILGNIFDDFEYMANCGIEPEVVTHTDMKFKFAGSYNRIVGSDFISGKYNGVSFEASNLHILYVPDPHDEDANERSYFKGQWFSFDLKKPLAADVILSENRIKNRVKKGTIKTDNDEFNKYYSIFSEDEESVFYVLTPHMMEFIIAMDKKAHADTSFHFQKDGIVHIAVDSGRELFKVDNMAKQSFDELVEQFENEAKYIINLINELKLSL